MRPTVTLRGTGKAQTQRKDRCKRCGVAKEKRHVKRECADSWHLLRPRRDQGQLAREAAPRGCMAASRCHERPPRGKPNDECHKQKHTFRKSRLARGIGGFEKVDLNLFTESQNLETRLSWPKYARKRLSPPAESTRSPSTDRPLPPTWFTSACA